MEKEDKSIKLMHLLVILFALVTLGIPLIQLLPANQPLFSPSPEASYNPNSSMIYLAVFVVCFLIVYITILLVIKLKNKPTSKPRRP